MFSRERALVSVNAASGNYNLQIDEFNDFRETFCNTPDINKPKISHDVSSHTKVKIESSRSEFTSIERAGFIFGPLGTYID